MKYIITKYGLKKITDIFLKIKKDKDGRFFETNDNRDKKSTDKRRYGK